jgi:hypothetical protein
LGLSAPQIAETKKIALKATAAKNSESKKVVFKRFSSVLFILQYFIV